MAKAIKHIQAGLLHIEVIGNIPERGMTKRRAGRSKPTSAAQAFYNLKTSAQELELWLAANFAGNDWVVTYTFDDAHLPKDKKGAGDLFQKHIRKLRSARKKRGEELKYIYVPEGFHGKGSGPGMGEDGELEDCRLHLHVVLNGTGAGDLEEIRSLWPYGGYIRAEPVDVHYYKELSMYLTKEAREFGRAKPGERTWRKSRNLTEYTVDYIEIPSDSVTLTAPYGAVDYRPFAEKNPYGFADCIGARYLLFPNKAEAAYTYARGRGRPASNNFQT